MTYLYYITGLILMVSLVCGGYKIIVRTMDNYRNEKMFGKLTEGSCFVCKSSLGF